MPEDLTDRKCCHKCLKTVTGKMKLSKCSRCHSITYCGQECQKKDWPRHREFCIPLMVAEIPDRGIGLVASKNFKMGELIFKESAMISLRANSPEGRHIVTLEMALALKEQLKNLSKEQKSKFYQLPPKKEFVCNPHLVEIGHRANCFKELMIMYSNCKYNNNNDRLTLQINSAFMRHSCTPNTTLYGSFEAGTHLEVRAVKDISKGEEVTYCYITEVNFTSQIEMKKYLTESFGFDCNCPVCSGKVSNQDEIRSELEKIMNTLPQLIHKQTQRNMKNWRVNVSSLERVVDLTQQLHIGDVFSRGQILVDIVAAAQLAREPVLLEKALVTLKDLVASWGFDGRFKELEKLKMKVQYWSRDFKSRKPPSKEEVDCFCLSSSNDLT